jgi:hypothetical protein
LGFRSGGREIAETEMSFVRFVLSAKRLKRQRKKPRKRKFKAKIDSMVRRIERVRSYKEDLVKRKEAVRPLNHCQSVRYNR